jgi:ABC-type lipoprotein export system ATPase subunit
VQLSLLLCAQMGPSGSGKTTLLDLLAGRKTVGKTEGSILFAGNKPTRPFLRRYTGYVEQFGECIPAGSTALQIVRHCRWPSCLLSTRGEQPAAQQQISCCKYGVSDQVASGQPHHRSCAQAGHSSSCGAAVCKHGTRPLCQFTIMLPACLISCLRRHAAAHPDC